MNRKQRREHGVKGPVKTYTLTDAQIQRMKEEAAEKAAKRGWKSHKSNSYVLWCTAKNRSVREGVCRVCLRNMEVKIFVLA